VGRRPLAHPRRSRRHPELPCGSVRSALCLNVCYDMLSLPLAECYEVCYEFVQIMV